MEFSETDESYSIYNSHGKTLTMLRNPNTKGGAFYKDFIVVMLLKAMGQNVIAHYHNKGVATRQDRVLDNFYTTIF